MNESKTAQAGAKAPPAAATFLPLQLATLAPAAPPGQEWLHEIKLDGFRILAARGGEHVTLLTRTGQDWTARFAAVAKALAELPTQNLVLDGEVVVMRPDGTTSFQALQNQMRGLAGGHLSYVAFDLLFVDGEDWRPRPLEERKERLAEIFGASGARGRVKASAPGRVVRFSEHVVGEGPAFFKKAAEAGLEGIVSKRRADPYRSGRGGSWLKVKAVARQEVVVGGFTEPEGARSGLGALLVGFFDGEGLEGKALRYAGKVGTGFRQRQAVELRARLEALRSERSPFAGQVAAAGRTVIWVKPEVVVEVAYAEITADGKLRHPSFQGLREDKRARDVTTSLREPMPAAVKPAVARNTAQAAPAQPASAPRSTRTKRPGRTTRATPAARTKRTTPAAQTPPPAGSKVIISHPDREMVPGSSFLKRDLAAYFEAVAPHLLAYAGGRPLALLRCPGGSGKPCFFMKHPAFAAPELRKVAIQEKRGEGTYLVVDDVAGLQRLAQMNVLEIHPWSSRADALETPDRLIVDLDPGPDVAWPEVARSAKLVAERLRHEGLVPFLKTTGGKGLHVVAPLVPGATFEPCLAFARGLCDELAASDPRRLTTELRKSGREKKILLDYLRNGRGATAVAAFSTRARPGAPVSVPLDWDELARFSPAKQFDPRNVLARLKAQKRDPWAGYDEAARALPVVSSGQG